MNFYAVQAQVFKSESVLSSGDIFKVGITGNGIYKIDASLLSSFGLDPSSIDPNEVRVYGNGGGMIPQKNSDFRYDDLSENAVMAIGGGDGAFSGSDHVLFYAEGADSKYLDTASGMLHHQTNLYADTNFYFIAVGHGVSKKIQEKQNMVSGGVPTSEFIDYAYHELESVNQLDRYGGTSGSGRLWFGEIFELIKSHTIDFEIPGILNGSGLTIKSRVMAQNTQTSKFNFSFNGSFYDSLVVGGTSNGTYTSKGRLANKISEIEASGINSNGNISIDIAFENNGTSATGMLDYVLLNVWRELRLYGNNVIFRSLPSSDDLVKEYQIAGSTGGLNIWDVSKKVEPLRLNYQILGGKAVFSDSTSSFKEYIAFEGSDFPKPVFIEKIANQNLHGYSVPQLLIISDPSLVSQAQRLADLRRSNDNLTVEVATTIQVYNEFSSGRQDITAIRDFIRMLYMKGGGASNGLKYVLLMGDATYDYKNINGRNQAKVPVYESYESLHPINSYSSDDYFGFMDDSEGEWQESSGGLTHFMELGIGRLPVRNLEEAKTVVDKLYNYENGNDIFGNWRNKVVFVADDGDANIHQRQANSLGSYVESAHKLFNVDRVFVDAFPQESTPAGKRSPSVTEEINRQIDNGVLILNYTGHGAERAWTSEQILDISHILSWENKQKLPLLVTATCEFGRYDNPKFVSGAEHAILNQKGGGIGLITTTRPVFSSSNLEVNEAFYETVFKRNNDGEYPRLGDVIRITKNESIDGVINRNFALLGDPSMKLAYPDKDIVITHINEEEVSESDTLSALEFVTLEGEIRDINGLVSGFEGILQVKVFDKLKELKTLGDEGPNTVMTYFNRENLLFQGKSNVTGGKFKIQFVVPKDINYQFGEGKISLYAKATNANTDAGGYSENLVIGGSSVNFSSDTNPPEIQLFLEDTTFKSGSVVPSNTVLYAKVYDENGINTSGHGLGHDIQAVLNNGEAVYNLNNFYSTELGDFRTGTINFPLFNLPEGKHNLTMTAWDTYNNASETTVNFRVSDSEEFEIHELTVVPNPMETYANFEFTHNRTGSDISATIMIYGPNGRFIKQLEQNSLAEGTFVNKIEWDGTNQYGSRVGSGIYFFKLYLYNPDSDESISASSKFVITR